MTTTITTVNATRDAFQVGDRLRVADTRRWWRKLLRRPKPQLDYVVTGCVGTVLTVEAPGQHVPSDVQ